MPTTNPAIEVQHLKKSYKNVPVLHDVSFHVPKGAIFALLGANGAGKTTTINILTTLLASDSGRASVAGFNVATDAASIRAAISLTGQFAAVDDILTGRENLALIADLRHVDNPADTAQALLKQFDLLDAADRRTATYSGGMRRRLDIAMSLIGNPSVVFLDEPTTGLDPQSRNVMWEIIRKLAAGGTTVFLTTQYLEEADQLADSIAVLNKGRIVAEGTAAQLKKLLPQGKIEFRFQDQPNFEAAATLFARHNPLRDDDARTLTVTTDGSVRQISGLFTALETAHIEVAEFSQKIPTLDEAFLKIISEPLEEK